MYKNLLFIIAHSAYDSRFYKIYKTILKNQYKSYEQLKLKQEKDLRNIIEFSYNNVPYYQKLFNQLKILPMLTTAFCHIICV